MRTLKLAALVASLSTALTAQAAINWSFSTSGTNAGGSNPGNTRTYSPAAAPSVVASAWANTTGTANTQIESAYLGWFSGGGLGATNRDAPTFQPTTAQQDAGEGVSPEHAVDNNGRYDSVLFSFSQSVNLSSILIGWPDANTTSLDTDFTVLAYTGNGTPPLATKTYGGATGLVANGWSLVGHFANGANTDPFPIPKGTFSSYWLVSAYNPTIDNRSCNSYDASYKYTCYNDYFKILKLTGDKEPPPPPPPGTGQGVPEPGTMLLLAAAGLGLGLRRRIRK